MSVVAESDLSKVGVSGQGLTDEASIVRNKQFHFSGYPC